MKRTRSVLLILLILVIALPVFAQFTNDATRITLDQGEIRYFYVALDSIADDTSATFTMQRYDSRQYLTFDMTDTASYVAIADSATASDTITVTFSMAHTYTQNFMPFPVGYIAGPTGPKISVFVDGSFDNSSWVVCDTLAENIAATTLTYTTMDMNNKRYPYYRMRFDGIATNPSDSWIKVWWYFYWARE